MSNTPQIRFAGFTDAWEQRKLIEIVKSIDTGKSKFQSDSDNGKFAILGSTSIIGYDDSYDYDGDFILTARVGANAGSLYRYTGKAKISDNTVFIQTEKNIEFVYYMLTKFDIKQLSFGTGQPLVKASELKNLDLKMPSQIEEQQKIGSFFSQLDTLITLHQRKCDALQKFKKSMLQKMFPQNGESVPEIRFAGFTDAWEQRKVGDVLSESRDAGHSGDIAKKLTVKLWGKGVYAKNDKGSAATQYFTRHAGQFIYSKLDFLNSAFGVVPQELESYESTADLPAFDCIAVEPYFMFYRAIQPSFYLTNGMIADGSRKAKRIHVETFLDMPLDLPSIEEQKKVASYFTQLDSLITLHQRKLETLQKMKKSLLQKMFV